MRDPTDDGAQDEPRGTLTERLTTRINELIGSDRGSEDVDGQGESEVAAEKRDEDAEDGEDEEVMRESLLTEEERVLRELKSSGRLRQSELVSRMDWSKGKMSRLLSDMEDAGQVSRVQVGREKVVALPEQQFDAAKSSTNADGRGSEIAPR